MAEATENWRVAIYDPNLKLSEAEKLAISILDTLLTRIGNGLLGNSGDDLIDVSPSEAGMIAGFLRELRASRKFVEAAFFTESITQGRGLTDRRAREIYLSWRTRLGKTRVASTYAWNEFVVRAGFGFSDNAQMYMQFPRRPVTPMHLAHFIAMEIRLAGAYGLSDGAIEIITDFYRQRLSLINEVRNGERIVPTGAVEQSAKDMTETFDAVAKCSPKKFLSKARLAACTGLIMDVGAMFITRDWTATGVASVAGTTFPDVIGVE